MARVVPDINTIFGGEKAVAIHLQKTLPPNWVVVNGVLWSRKKPVAGKRTGEIDFVVISPSSVIHVIEHTDDIAELDTDGNVVVSRNGKPKNKSRQLAANREVVIQLLQEFESGSVHRSIHSWLFVPNADISSSTPSMNADSIVDRSATPDPLSALSARILATESDKGSQRIDERLITFLQNKTELTVDPTSISDNELRFVNEYDPVPSLILNVKCEAKIVKIEGVAGSGKTQIALIGLRRAHKKGVSAVLISNSKTIPHRLSDAGQFELNAFHYDGFQKEMESNPSQKFEQIFVEEAHQLGTRAIELIKGHLSYTGKMFLLFDSNQDLDGRLDLKDDVVSLTLTDSFRVPRGIADNLNGFSHTDPKIRSSREVEGDPWNLHIADDSKASVEAAISSMSDFIAKKPHLANRCAFVFGSTDPELKNFDWPESWRLLTDEGSENSPVVDTIRRFQGSSRDFVFAAGFKDKVSSALSADRYIYTAATRARIRVDIWLPRAWTELI